MQKTHQIHSSNMSPTCFERPRGPKIGFRDLGLEIGFKGSAQNLALSLFGALVLARPPGVRWAPMGETQFISGMGDRCGELRALPDLCLFDISTHGDTIYMHPDPGPAGPPPPMGWSAT